MDAWAEFCAVSLTRGELCRYATHDGAIEYLGGVIDYLIFRSSFRLAMDLLQIPEWFPRCLVPKANELHARELRLCHEAGVALVERLVTDPRMEMVWQELGKAKRVEHQSTSQPLLNLQKDLFPAATSTYSNGHIWSCLFIVLQLLDIRNLPGGPIPYIECAQQLRLDAATVAAERPQKAGAPIVKKLIAAAEAYELLAVTPRPRDQIVSITTDIVELTSERFGTPLYGTVATIVSVAVDEKVSVDFVRTAAAALWAKKEKAHLNDQSSKSFDVALGLEHSPPVFGGVQDGDDDHGHDQGAARRSRENPSREIQEARPIAVTVNTTKKLSDSVTPRSIP